MSRNLGETSLRRRRRSNDPMRDFDALPPEVRRWLAGAILPWSPRSCRRIWQPSRAKGESTEGMLARLDRAEQKTLARDRRVPAANRNSFN